MTLDRTQDPRIAHATDQARRGGRAITETREALWPTHGTVGSPENPGTPSPGPGRIFEPESGIDLEGKEFREVAGRKLNQLRIRSITNATEATWEADVLAFFRGEAVSDGRVTGGGEKRIIAFRAEFVDSTYVAFILYTDG